MVDSHTHLSFCEPPDAELVARAVEAGAKRIVTVGTTGVTCREALGAAEDFPQVYAAIGRHPALCWVVAGAAFWAVSTRLGLPNHTAVLDVGQELGQHYLYGLVNPAFQLHGIGAC